MAKLTRYTQKVFGSTASANQIAEFGSLAAGSPSRFSGATITPTIVQALSNYLDGWVSAQVGAGNPAIEDMNALCYLFGYQLSYLMQQGVPEWDTNTIYFIGSLVSDGAGNIYLSKTNSNTANALSSTANWIPILATGTPQISSSSGNYFTFSSTYADVTNLSQSITTIGRPVEIYLQADGTSGTTGSILVVEGSASATNNDIFGSIQILRGVTVIAEMNIGCSGGAFAGVPLIALRQPSSVINFLDQPAAGTYTYKVQAKVVSSNITSPSFGVLLSKLVVRET